MDASRNCIYMDHAATTPVRKEALAAMEPFFSERFGNASSLHAFGREAKAGLERARHQVADLIGASPEEIVFTSGGTESDNFALVGVALRCQDRGKHIVSTHIEHHAVLHALTLLETLGFEVQLLRPEADGIVPPEAVKQALRQDTILVSVMTANNEIGSLQPIAAMGETCAEREIVFHTDAVQAAGAISLNVQEMSVNLLSLSGHKIYGPKGIGALYIRAGTPMASFIRGGDQERRRRGGTENVAGAVGMGVACQLAKEEMPNYTEKMGRLRDRLIDGLFASIDGIRLNGHPTRRLPNNVNVSFEDIPGDSLIVNLDLEGLAVSNGSACSSGSPEPSHVLKAIGLTDDLVESAVRYSLGRETTFEEVDDAAEVTCAVVQRLRRIRGHEK